MAVTAALVLGACSSNAPRNAPAPVPTAVAPAPQMMSLHDRVRFLLSAVMCLATAAGAQAQAGDLAVPELESYVVDEAGHPLEIDGLLNGQTPETMPEQFVMALIENRTEKTCFRGLQGQSSSSESRLSGDLRHAESNSIAPTAIFNDQHYTSPWAQTDGTNRRREVSCAT